MIILGLFTPVPHRNIHCRYSLEVPWLGTSNELPQKIFYVEIRKIIPELLRDTHSLSRSYVSFLRIRFQFRIFFIFIFTPDHVLQILIGIISVRQFHTRYVFVQIVPLSGPVQSVSCIQQPTLKRYKIGPCRKVVVVERLIIMLKQQFGQSEKWLFQGGGYYWEVTISEGSIVIYYITAHMLLNSRRIQWRNKKILLLSLI